MPEFTRKLINIPVMKLMFFAVMFVITTVATPINGSTQRKLLQCGTPCSSCSNPCYQSPPLPPPPPPPPPPPHHKKEPSQYCPPPPSGGPFILPPSGPFVYTTGPPGSLYPIDTYASGGGRNFAVELPLLIGCGLVGLLAFCG